MSFDWADYLLVAQELVSQTAVTPKVQNTAKTILLTVINRMVYRNLRGASARLLDEAKLRCAISRAYYGAFRKARNHLRNKDGHPLSLLVQGNTHQKVIDLFSQSSDKDRQKIGQFLKDLRSARNRAGYEDVVSNLEGLALTALLQSERVLAVLTTL